MEGLQEVTNALSNGSTIRDPIRPPVPLDQGSQRPTKTPIAIISGTAKATHLKFSMHIHRVDQIRTRRLKMQEWKMREQNAGWKMQER